MNSTAKKIKKLMVDLGVSQAGIARKAGVDRSAINHVVFGRVVSPHLRKIIAKELGSTVKELWSEGQSTAREKVSEKGPLNG